MHPTLQSKILNKIIYEAVKTFDFHSLPASQMSYVKLSLHTDRITSYRAYVNCFLFFLYFFFIFYLYLILVCFTI